MENGVAMPKRLSVLTNEDLLLRLEAAVAQYWINALMPHADPEVLVTAQQAIRTNREAVLQYMRPGLKPVQKVRS